MPRPVGSAVTDRAEVVLASAGVTESQLPPEVVDAAVVNDTAADADKLIVWVKGTVEPNGAVGVQPLGLGVMAGGAEPVATMFPSTRANEPGLPPAIL